MTMEALRRAYIAGFDDALAGTGRDPDREFERWYRLQIDELTSCRVCGGTKRVHIFDSDESFACTEC